MEPVNFLQSSLDIKQEFVKLGEHNAVDDPLTLDNDFVAHNETISNQNENDEMEPEETVIINENINKNIDVPKTDDEVEPIEQIVTGQDLNLINKEGILQENGCEEAGITEIVESTIESEDVQNNEAKFDELLTHESEDAEVQIAPVDAEVHIAPENAIVHIAPEDAEVHIAPEDAEVQIAPVDAEVHIAPENAILHIAPEDAEVHIAPEDVEVHIAPEDAIVHIAPEDAIVHIAPEDAEVHIAPEDAEVYIAPEDAEVYIAPEDAEVYIETEDVEVYIESEDAEVHIETEDVEIYIESEELAIEDRKVESDKSIERTDIEDISTSKEVEEMPTLIPIKSVRQEDKAPTEMPPLIPITKHNNRMYMAQLIERKLQSEIEVYNYIDTETNKCELNSNYEITNGTDHIPKEELETKQDEIDLDIEVAEICVTDDMETDKLNNSDHAKIPLIGSVCKNERRIGRLTKPPWLMQNSREEIEEVDEVMVDGNIGDTREKLCSQLQMLKVKKKTEPLFQTNIPNFSNTHYEKRVIKQSPAPLNLATETSSPLGFKIVAVAGGVDMDNCSELMSLGVSMVNSDLNNENLIHTEAEETMIQEVEVNCSDSEETDVQMEETNIAEEADINIENDEEKNHWEEVSPCSDIDDFPIKEVIINEHLDQPTIKLTKTKDYKKIKGWNKKKLLTLDKPLDEDNLSQEHEQDPKPGCSYLISDKTNIEIKEVDSSVPIDSTVEVDNIFASNSLDGFLEEKDLNISYNVPNLKSSNQNINLLDNCVLVDIGQEKKIHTKLEPDDSTSNSSFKEVYKPRTLAEKRKMMFEEKDGIVESKKSKFTKTKEKNFSRRPYASKYDTGMFSTLKAHNESKITEESNESLLIPLQNNIPNVILDDETSSDLVFLNEEQSKPKNCVISKVRFRSKEVLSPCSVVTRKPIKRIFYFKHQDIKRKAKYDLVPKSRGAMLFREKPSILKSSEPPVVYKPGPLCKKQELQVNGCKEWETVLVNLPKVDVSVIPQLRKKIHPRVRQFVKFESFDITEDRANFALSALITNNESADSFRFPAQYKHKQEKIVMRRIIRKTEQIQAPMQKIIETEADILNSVQIVIGKILDYVEVKGLETSLLNFDGDTQCKIEADTEPMEETTKHRRHSGLDKSGRELKRLSVRVVNLPIEESTETNSTCTNQFCKYGCICQSISNKYPPFNHCGEAKCIFECICGFAANCKYNTCKQEDLDEGTLSRFSKEAKRNITAREERAFTQTAIRSNNNTIIVGNNRINKRRPKYNFKRFEGFQFSFTDDKISKTRDDAWMFEDDKMLINDWKLYNCSVAVVKCNFDDLVPFCLVHNLYDCHCGGTAVYTHYEQSLNSRKSFAQLFPKVDIENDPIEQPIVEKTVKRAPKLIPNLIQAKTNENTVSNIMGLASRIRGIGEYFRIRNNSNKYKNIMARKLKYDTTVNPDIVNKWIILPPDRNLIEQRKQHQIQTIADKLKSDHTITIEPYSNEYPKESRVNKRMKKVEEKKPATLGSIATSLTLTGALYTPAQAMCKQFSEMIGEKNADSIQYRLLMWLSFVKLYENNVINIWYCNNNSKLRFIITDCTSNPTETFENIKNFEGMDKNKIKVDFIRWIVTKSMPDNKNGDNVLVIIKIMLNCWEVCGICAKKNESETNLETPEVISPEKTPNKSINIPISDITPTKDRTPDLALSENQKEYSTSDTEQALYSKTDKKTTNSEGTTEKLYKTVRHVMFSNGTFPPKQLQLVDPADRLKGDAHISAALPHIVKNCKWRVLKVNSNFAILSFTKNEFSIKCSDILTVMKVSSKYNKTIIINTKAVSQNFKHKSFGIYIPSTYQDRIFIGPYLDDEEHGIETLRFFNNKLVDTEVFNTMRGIKNIACTGLWYSQVGRVSEQNSIKESVSADCIIDLTDIDEVCKVMQNSDLTITPTPIPISAKFPNLHKQLKNGSIRRSRSKKDKSSLRVNNSVDTSSNSIATYDDNAATITVSTGNDCTSQQLTPRLLIPKISADNKITYNQVMINIPPGVNFLPNVIGSNSLPKISIASGINAQEGSDTPPTLSKFSANTVVQRHPKSLLKSSFRATTPTNSNTTNRNKMPELIKIPLACNKTNKNITNVHINKSMDQLMDVATLENIIDQAKAADPVRRENLFNMRLKVIMKQLNINIPQQAKPICFRMNFGNGIILGFEMTDVVHVFWPGDCKRKFEFDHINEATAWLTQELHAVFICIPSTFKIVVTPVQPTHYMEYINRGIISQKYFKEICIIGDFGIMRLSEAQPYLLYDDPEVAQKQLELVQSKPFKFKKAMSQIIAANDMSRAGFLRKVSNLIAKAKAAADNFAQLQSSHPLVLIDTPPVLKPQTLGAEDMEEVICLDSDSDGESESNSHTTDVPAMITNTYNSTFEKLQERLNSQRSRPKAKARRKRVNKVHKDNNRKKRRDVMQIDLTHMSTEKVRALLQHSQVGNRIALTKEQVEQLQALSQKNGSLP